MWLMCFLIIQVVRVTSRSIEFQDEGLYHERLEELVDEKRLPVEVTRCTRRFTPGSCMDSVASVWHFTFHTRNCSERLGCSVSGLSNRFRSYAECKAICWVVLRLFSQDGDGDISDTGNSSRRADFDYVIKDSEVPEWGIDNVSEDQEDEHMDKELASELEDEPEAKDLLYPYEESDDFNLGDVMPSNLDYVFGDGT